MITITTTITETPEHSIQVTTRIPKSQVTLDEAAMARQIMRAIETATSKNQGVISDEGWRRNVIDPTEGN